MQPKMFFNFISATSMQEKKTTVCKEGTANFYVEVD